MTFDIVHDTYIIIDASERACRIFKCEREELIDRLILDFVAGEDFRALCKLRMKMLRQHGYVPPVRLPFRRDDRSCFWALVSLIANRDDGTFEFDLAYEFEEPCM